MMRAKPLDFRRDPPETLLARAAELDDQLQRRRSIRMFSTDPVPREVIEHAVRIAASAPSGAHLQPWTWVIVGDAETKQQLRDAAEREERAFYAERATPQWLAALEPLGTDEVKTHLTDAPWVIVLFRHRWHLAADGSRSKNYYSAESCGIAAGFLLSALHQIGLCALVHTPSPMGFLRELLERPEQEQAFLVIPVGYPADDCVVPDIARKPLDEVAFWR